jgi:Fe2+ transport system protein FeoA
LYWYDRQGQRYLTPEELAKQEQQLRIQAEERANKLAERLRSLGIDPDFLS